MISSASEGQSVGCKLVINEILFNPPKDGSDYIELYNNGTVALDLSDYLIANRNARGAISSIKRITRELMMLRPREYAVLTSDPEWLREHYVLPASAIVVHSSLPSYPDDEGTVVLLSQSDSSVCDELTYHESWHFSLINDPTGVALERISTTAPTSVRHNWTSASSSSKYGTPAYVNSQHRLNEPGEHVLSITPSIFSPDNDGVDDFVMLSLRPSVPGYVANTIIYDASGRRVRYLLKNEVIGSNSTFRWDGLGDDNNRLPPGAYICVTEFFNLQGDARKFKNVVVIGSGK